MCKREQMLADSLQQTKHNYSDLKTAQRWFRMSAVRIKTEKQYFLFWIIETACELTERT